jgi:hypothetical protein
MSDTNTFHSRLHPKNSLIRKNIDARFHSHYTTQAPGLLLIVSSPWGKLHIHPAAIGMGV